MKSGQNEPPRLGQGEKMRKKTKMRAPRFKRGNKRSSDRQECASLRVGRAASKMQRYGGVIIKKNADLCERVRYADRERQTDRHRRGRAGAAENTNCCRVLLM